MKIENSGYSEHGASRRKTSLIKWTASSKSAHEDISENVEILRERSRDLYAGGGPLGRGAIDRLVLNAIGGGLKLNVRIDPDRLGMSSEQAAEWASNTEARFDFWASIPKADFNNELNFYDLQVLALRSILLDGEVMVLIHHDPLRIQLIEAERLMTPPPGWAS